jgi:hypothetical protein
MLFSFFLLGVFFLILRYIDKELLGAILYYSNPEVLLKDSSGYMFFYIITVVPLYFSLLVGLLYYFMESIYSKKYKFFLSFLLLSILFHFGMKKVSTKALHEEIIEINYYRLHKEALHASNSRKIYIAQMLEKDCEIKVFELNRDMFFKELRPKINHDMFHAGQCNLELDGKKNLVKYLNEEKLLSYY